MDFPPLPAHCRQCGIFLHGHDDCCGECLSNSPPFHLTHALYPYEWPVTSLIIKLKFHHQLIYARVLGELLAQAVQARWYAGQPLPDCILPVPLHPERMRERGFNQALEIARSLSGILKLPIDNRGIRRIRHTAAQSSLPAASRRQNIAQAFAACRDYGSSHIALLDDVITTGHTVRECAHVLKTGGARRIDIWCCARRG